MRVFISKQSGEIELLYSALKKEFNEISLIETNDIKTIYAPENIYFDVLKRGTDIANLYNIKVHYVNSCNEVRELNYLSMMYLVLRSTRKGDSMWETGYEEYCPLDIKRYIQYIKNYTGCNYVQVKYIWNDNALELLFKCSYDEFENLSQKCKAFVNFKDTTLFEDICFFDITGKLENQDKHYSRVLK